MSLKRELGKKIKTIREGLNLSQEKFAEQIGISANSISRIENGLTFPKSETIEKIARRAKLDYYELFMFNNHASKHSYSTLKTYIDNLSEQEASYFLSCVKAFLKLKNQGK